MGSACSAAVTGFFKTAEVHILAGNDVTCACHTPPSPSMTARLFLDV